MPTTPTVHPADARVQKELEQVVLQRACEARGLPAAEPRTICLGDGSKVKLDGWIEVSGGQPYAVEVYVKLGGPKSAQASKLAKDVLRLAVASMEHPAKPRGVILTTSPEVASWLETGWIARARALFGVEVWSVTLTPEEEAKLRAARAAQAVGNRSVAGRKAKRP